MGKLGVNGLQQNSKENKESPIQLLSVEHQGTQTKEGMGLSSLTNGHHVFSYCLGTAAGTRWI